MKRSVLLVCSICMMLCFGPMAWCQERFVVVGSSERGDQLPNATLEMAIKDGLRKAIQEAIGEVVALELLGEQERRVLQEVHNRAESFVLSYRVVEEAVLPTGYQVLLEVLVDTRGIKRNLESLGILRTAQVSTPPRTVRLVVNGLRSHQVYLNIDGFLREAVEGVEDVILAEIEPTRFTWRLAFTGKTDELADRFLHGDFSGHVITVKTVTSELLEIDLFARPSMQEGGGP